MPVKLKKSAQNAPKADTSKKSTPSNENAENDPFLSLWGGVGKVELPLTEKQKLIFSISQNKETKEVFADIRVHITSKKYTGLTSKGITVSASKFEEFCDVIATMRDEVEHYDGEDWTEDEE